METIVIDKENAVSSFQEILVLISEGKTLEVKELDTYSAKIQESLDNAIKEYENGEYKTLLTVE